MAAGIFGMPSATRLSPGVMTASCAETASTEYAKNRPTRTERPMRGMARLLQRRHCSLAAAKSSSTIASMKALLLASVAGASLLYAQSAARTGEWQTYAGDAQGRRYSPLTQINTTNVAKLKLAWQYGV